VRLDLGHLLLGLQADLVALELSCQVLLLLDLVLQHRDLAADFVVLLLNGLTFEFGFFSFCFCLCLLFLLMTLVQVLLQLIAELSVCLGWGPLRIGISRWLGQHVIFEVYSAVSRLDVDHWRFLSLEHVVAR
jgi:hypothetical protein